jgi:FkbM family methyltransferase
MKIEEQLREIIKENTKELDNKLVVDIGATGFYSAASLLVLKDNWSGILFEPHPRSAQELREQYKNRDEVLVLEYAISNKEGKMEFLCHPDYAVSSLEPNCTWYKADTQVKKIYVEVKKIGNILEKLLVRKDFTFLKIDAEGFDYRILENMFNESQYRPLLIMHEIQHPGPKVFEELINKNGYTLIKKVTGNMLYRRN